MNPEINIQPLREVSLPYGNLRSQLLDGAILFRGNIMKEIWLPIKGYEGKYEISNFGRAKSLAKEWLSGHVKRIKPDTIFRPGSDKRGYFAITLRKDNKSTTFKIHHLVWDHFGDRPRNGRKLQVDHKDENKQNNHIDNLQLLTNRQNVHKSLLINKTNDLPLGVIRVKQTTKYLAKIKLNGKTKFLGYYKTIAEAQQVYNNKLEEIENEQSNV